MAIREIMIYTEDTYGVDFFRELVYRLQEEGHVGDFTLRALKLAGLCREKMKRQIIASAGDYCKVIVVVDGDGKERNEVHKRVMEHVPVEIQDKVQAIIFQFMIEEWICNGLNIRYRDKPSQDLNDWLRDTRGYKNKYEKYMLPNFVGDLDFQKLQNDANFNSFIDTLNDP